MSQLPATQNLPPNRLISKELSELLPILLPKTALDVYSLARDPAVLAACQICLPELHGLATAEATPSQIRDILGKRFAVFPQPERSEAEWRAWWEDYVIALEGLSPTAIEAAMKAFVALPDSEFFPKPGRIRELARLTPNFADGGLAAAQIIIDHDKRRQRRQIDDASAFQPVSPPVEAPEFTEEEKTRNREAVKGILAETLAALKLPPDRPKMRPTHGRADATGITPAMRDLLGRQRA